MSNLLQVIRVKPDAMSRKGVTPLILEFNVDPQTVPYLVSSTTGFMWVDSPHEGTIPTIKAAVRKGVRPGDLFWEASEAIYNRSLELQWGSAHPFTEAGVAAAIDHVDSYDMGQLDILVGHASGPTKKHPDWLLEKNIGHRVRMSAWIPDDCAIIVPTDRQFVGMMVHLSPTAVAIAVHNPSRGFAMCRGA